MDLTPTITAKSDQQNYEDYGATVERTVTITDVKKGSDEQPVEVHLAEFPGKPYKPSKSMRRVLVALWGKQGSVYVGRKLTLYGDPKVKYGGVEVGGIKIRAASHIDEPLTVALTETRGHRKPHTVGVLPTEPTAEEVAACTDDQVLREWWGISSPERQAQIKARAAELKTAAEPTQPTLDEGADQ